jgi:acyl carrier protein
MQQYMKEITAFVIEEFLPDVRPDQLATDYDLVAGGVLDSLGVLKVIAWLEDRFGLATDDVEISPDDFRSIDAIARFAAQTADSAGVY